MKSQMVTNVLLLVIAAMLLILCIQNTGPQKVVIYQDGSPVGSGLRTTRGHALPVWVVHSTAASQTY